MTKLNKIQITGEESATLKAAQAVAENIWLRFRDANGGRWTGELNMKMEIARAADDTPHAWWTVHPHLEHMQTGHNMTLEAALSEMHGRTESDVKRKYAQRYKDEAERLEKEAHELELAGAK